jgi:hypothetical protein
MNFPISTVAFLLFSTAVIRLQHRIELFDVPVGTVSATNETPTRPFRREFA